MNAQLALSFDRRRRPQVPFYATTPMSIHQLADAIRVAQLQDEAVLAIFRAMSTDTLTPSQVHRIGEANGLRWLLTSTRRSISNLTDACLLQRLNATRMGPHGRPEYTWSLRSAA